MSDMTSHICFILLGDDRAGKSATGNFILRKNAFVSRNNTGSFIQEAESHSVKIDQRVVTVVDTPGPFDTKGYFLPTLTNIQSSLDFAQSGPHCFLLVIPFGKTTEIENYAAELLKILFGPNVLKQTIIVFTQDDDATERWKNIDELVNVPEENVNLKALLDECGRRHITLNYSERNAEIRREKLHKMLMMADTLAIDWKGFYKESFSVYKRVLQKYAEDWKGEHLTAEQVRIIKEDQKREEQKYTIFSNVAGALLGAGAGALGVATYAVGPVAVVALTAAIPVITKHFK